MNPKKQTILFDLDDTLIHCNKYFTSTIDQFASQMDTWFNIYSVTEEQIKQKQLEIDLVSVNNHGFQTDRFPQSLVNTYGFFSQQTKRPVQKQELDWLSELGYSVFEQAYEPFPNVSEILNNLKENGHELFLYTGGDVCVQERKIKNAGLEPFFEDIFIREHKTLPVLEQILNTKKFNRNFTWMIGNSERTDILPALKAGIHAIHIPIPAEWEFNKAEINVKPKGAFLTLSSLHEVTSVIPA